MQSRQFHRSSAPQNCSARGGPFWSWCIGCTLLFVLVAPLASFAEPQDEGEAASPPAAATIAVPIGYLTQGLVMFDVLPIYISYFTVLALANYAFGARVQP